MEPAAAPEARQDRGKSPRLPDGPCRRRRGSRPDRVTHPFGLVRRGAGRRHRNADTAQRPRSGTAPAWRAVTRWASPAGRRPILAGSAATFRPI